MILNLLRKNILNLRPYSSARDEFQGEATTWLDANESATTLPNMPLGINRYPASQLKELRKQIANLKEVDVSQVFIGNGSDEAVDLLFRIFCNPAKDKALIFPPTYGMYGVCAAVNDVEVIESQLDGEFNINLKDFEQKSAQNPKLTFICNPNNPSGNTQKVDIIRQIIEKSKGIVVVDEAYIDFCPNKSVIGWINQYSNLVVLQTLSKAWGLAAARVGLAFASPEIISIMNKVKFPYNVGKPSMDIALCVLKQEEAMKARVRETLETLDKLAKDLENLPQCVKVYPSEANYLLVKFKESQEVYRKLASNGIVVRDRGSQPGCEGCLRITVGTKKEVEVLLNILKQF